MATPRARAAAERHEAGEHARSRWPYVVRTLVLLGAPAGHAHELARRCVVAVGAGAGGRRDQPVTRDPDVDLFSLVLEAYRAEPLPGGPAPAALPPEVEHALDRLHPLARSRLVLRVAGRLSPAQLEELLGVSDDVERGSLPPLPDLEPVVAAIAVRAVPEPVPEPGPLRARVQTFVGPGLTAGLAGTVGLVLVAGLAIALSRGAADPASPRLPVTTPTSRPTADDVPLAWYDGSQLRVGDLAVDVGEVEDLVETDGGVVVATSDGTVSLVSSDATTTRLGRRAPEGGLAAHDGFVGFLAGGPPRSLVILRAQQPTTPLRVPVPATATVAGFGDGGVLLALPGESRLVRPDGSSVSLPDALLARTGPRGSSISRTPDGRLRLSGASGSTLVVGDDAGLSPDGRYALVRTRGLGSDPSSNASAGSAASSASYRVVDLQRGSAVRLPLPVQRFAGERRPPARRIPTGYDVLDAEFASSTTLVLVVELEGDGEDERGAQYVVAVCDLTARTCRAGASTPVTPGPPPVLAGAG